MTRQRLRVVVADDSPTMRVAIASLLAEEGDIEVVAEAKDGREAIALARTARPDVVTLDIQMPHVAGVEAVTTIMAEAPCRIVVVCSVGRQADVDEAFRAIDAGALEVVEKPSVESAEELRAWGRRLRETTRLMSQIPVVRRRRRAVPTGAPWTVERPRLVAIAASTGGPPAVARLLAALPRDLGAPVLLAQHMAPGFARGLSVWLSGETSLPVLCVSRATTVAPGCVYLPTDGADLELTTSSVVDVAPCAGPYYPSADRLLTSVARTAGRFALGVVLTGMGEDGAKGLAAIRRAGGVTIAQDEASSVVWGMPWAAVRAGAATRVLPLDAIAPAIVACVPAGARDA